MKKIIIMIMIIALMISFCGCATVHKATSKEIATINYGPYPDNWKYIVDKSLYYYYYRIIIPPFKGSLQYGMKTYYGYLVCIGIRQRTTYGGYINEQRMILLIRNNKPLTGSLMLLSNLKKEKKSQKYQSWMGEKGLSNWISPYDKKRPYEK